MKCPKCGRFSKRKESDEDGVIRVYSECAVCGIIKVENLNETNAVKESTGSGSIMLTMFSRIDYVKFFLAVLTLALLYSSTFFYFQLMQKNNLISRTEESYQALLSSYYTLEENYLTLLNTTEDFEKYYNELQEMYTTVRNEYSNLEDMYSLLAQEKSQLQNQYSALHANFVSVQKELDDILSFSKDSYLERNASYEIHAGKNRTLLYNISYAGFIDVNFTSSTEIYFWVGSSVANGYYARYPSFPYTSYNGTFTIPVSHDVYLFVVNSNENENTNITLSIKYTY